MWEKQTAREYKLLSNPRTENGILLANPWAEDGTLLAKRWTEFGTLLANHSAGGEHY